MHSDLKQFGGRGQYTLLNQKVENKKNVKYYTAQQFNIFK